MRDAKELLVERGGSETLSFPATDWRMAIWGGPKKSKSCSRPAREVRCLAWCSACLKKHIYSDIRHCKILTFFVVYFETWIQTEAKNVIFRLFNACSIT